MQWTKEFIYVPQYEHTSSGSRGDRFKCTGTKQLSVARLSCNYNDAEGLTKLILLSHHLDVPVRYSFDGDQEAYIKVVSQEALEGVV
jgi:hypothetical protein